MLHGVMRRTTAMARVHPSVSEVAVPLVELMKEKESSLNGTIIPRPPVARSLRHDRINSPTQQTGTTKSAQHW